MSKPRRTSPTASATATVAAARVAAPLRTPFWRRADTWLTAALIVATVAAYWPSMHGTMLWDDAAHITRPELRSLSGLWRIWFDLGATQQYYPLLHSAFWVEHRLWAETPLGYHAVNVALHIASALLVRVILVRLGVPGAWLAAFVFALHPVQTESVSWMTEQKNTLSTMFYLAAAAAYLRFDDTRARRVYVLASALFLCALASKTTRATLPAALLVILWWKHGRLGWRRDVARLGPWLVTGVIGGVFTAWVERTYIGADGSDFSLRLVERVLLAGRVVWFYARSVVWPVHLSFNYPRWTIDAGQWSLYLYVSAVVLLVAACWLWRRRSRAPLAAVLFFVGTLTPVLGFLNVYPFVYSYVADHFEYVAMLGVVVPAAALVTMGVERLPRRLHLFGRAAAIAVVCLLAAMTWRQSAMYRNVETLYTETVSRNPQSWMAYENLGVLLATQADRIEDAIDAFESAVRIRPDRARAHRNLALALSHVPGRADEAIAEYRAVLLLDPSHADDHLRLGRLLLAKPSSALDARREVEAALRLDPHSAGAHFTMGNILARARDPRAETEYLAAIDADPRRADVRLNFGNFLASSSRTTQALVQYAAALRLRPDYVEAHFNRGTLLMDLPDRAGEAVAELGEAVRLRPRYAEAQSNLALAIMRSGGSTAEAIRHVEAALSINPSLEPARDVLDLLQARAGRDGAAPPGE